MFDSKRTHLVQAVYLVPSLLEKRERESESPRARAAHSKGSQTRSIKS